MILLINDFVSNGLGVYMYPYFHLKRACEENKNIPLNTNELIQIDSKIVLILVSFDIRKEPVSRIQPRV